MAPVDKGGEVGPGPREDDVVRTNSTEEIEGVGEDGYGDGGWIGEFMRSMLLRCVDGCCGKNTDAMDREGGL